MPTKKSKKTRTKRERSNSVSLEEMRIIAAAFAGALERHPKFQERILKQIKSNKKFRERVVAFIVKKIL